MHIISHNWAIYNMSSAINIKRICEFCGSEFEAQKTTTRFCSHSCNSKSYKARIRNDKIEKSELETAKVRDSKFDKIELVQKKELLTISDAALFLSVSKRTIYNWLDNGTIIGKRISNRKVLISKEDIRAIFESNQAYEKPTPIIKKPITEFYTINEVKEKYNIGNTWLYKIINRYKIPKTMLHGKTFVSKKHIDKYFEKKEKDIDNISVWYTVQEIMDVFNLSRNQIYSRVKLMKIPQKKQGKFSLISKQHFDEQHILKL